MARALCADGVEQVALLQLTSRNVDGDEWQIVAHARAHQRQRLAHVFENVSAHRHDELGFFGQRDELGGRHRTALRMFPAHQGFVSGHALGIQIVDRLQAYFERTIVQGVA